MPDISVTIKEDDALSISTSLLNPTLGFTGSRGEIGFTGSQGIQGIQGFTGSQGLQGLQGFTGSRGLQGIQGFTGSQGIQGTQGFTGSQGPPGSDAAVTSASIITALGYTPANERVLDDIQSALDTINGV